MSEPARAVDLGGVPSWRWCRNEVDEAARPAAQQYEGMT
jgi:hypothetical protein